MTSPSFSIRATIRESRDCEVFVAVARADIRCLWSGASESMASTRYSARDMPSSLRSWPSTDPGSLNMIDTRASHASRSSSDSHFVSLMTSSVVSIY